MLFDKNHLAVFDNNESKMYFSEILQLYYSQNYRSSIVMLYSFVIYDLYIKMQMMANEGDSKAQNKLTDINTMISDDEKYSKVENEIIQFFLDNCELYFNRFKEDIEYLKNCRNKCAHLKVNDNTLYIPKDYVTRMLICSMYDNVLSVKAPFIMDLFNVTQSDIELYSAQITSYKNDTIIESIIEDIKSKYLQRMTYDSIKKSYKTFAKLLWVSDDGNVETYAYGLYVFINALTDYAVKEGFLQLFMEDSIISVFNRVDIDTISAKRRQSLIRIVIKYPIVLDVIRSNDKLFKSICRSVLRKPKGLRHYHLFYPRSTKSAYAFFLETPSLQRPIHTESLYSCLYECSDFNIEEFMTILINRISPVMGFDEADAFMQSFKSHISELSIESIERILEIYNQNNQCTGRIRHSRDMDEVNSYLEEQRNQADSTDDTNDNTQS